MFVFALFGNIVLNLIAIIVGSAGFGFVDPFRVVNFIFNLALFFLVLVTLIMQVELLF